MPLTIVPNNALTVLVASTVNAVTTDEIELNPFYKYTLMCTTLTNNTESINIEIYDSSTDTFIPMMVAGSRVRMTKDYELLTFVDTGAIIKIIKPITSAPCGVTLVYR